MLREKMLASLGALLFISLVIIPPVATGTIHNVDYMTQLENEVLREHNLVRTDPQAYADHLTKWLRYYRGKMRKLPGRRRVYTNEGVGAVKEAISFLHAAKPLPPLTPSSGLSRAARDHVRDTGRKGVMGHLGTDDSEPGDRVSRYGTWFGRVGENITYGGRDARELVIRLLIDDGHPDRLHRENIFQGEFLVSGVSIGRHAEFGSMCVITYAAEFESE
jgi:uncharacterized protein YkwD